MTPSHYMYIIATGQAGMKRGGVTVKEIKDVESLLRLVLRFPVRERAAVLPGENPIHQLPNLHLYGNIRGHFQLTTFRPPGEIHQVRV